MTELKAVAHVSSGRRPQPNRLRRRASTLAAVTAVASLGLVATASAKNGTTPLSGGCGQTLTVSDTYVLQNDIGPCSSTAITITGNNITLDLNGHTVSGAGAPGSNDGPGIQAVGTSGDVIMNGTVEAFDAGVLLTQSNASPPVKATYNTVTNLNVLNNVGTQPPDDFSDGIALISANHNTISNNTLSGNGSRAIGLIDSSSNNTISGNTITNNTGSGVRLSLFDTRNVITGNTISNNAGTGVSFMFSDTRNLIQSNTINANGGGGVGISFLSSGNTVANNSITNNGRDGISFGAGHETAKGNTVTGNGKTGSASNGNADGIFLTGGDTGTPSGGDVIADNVVLNNVGNGIRVTCTVDANTGVCTNHTPGNRIVNNDAFNNGGSAAGTQILSGSGFLIGVYDLLDGNNSINDAATSPAGTATPCGSNIWSGNYDGGTTAYPACTQAGA